MKILVYLLLTYPTYAEVSGKSMYIMQCMGCHNAEPRYQGSTGPAIYGSSLELLEAKVLRGEYPNDYVPKRRTMMMPRMGYLEQYIPSLYEYLND